ncbi:MAG: UMP kinase [Verrucomicrobiota bacterium]|nr:UMP kinase [Verrucomicrobiota bacterium]
MPSLQPKYKRIILKLSGEALGGKGGDPISPEILESLALQVKDLVKLKIQLGIVIGGGNIFRGLTGTQQGIDRTTGDYMGMLATVINGLALQNTLEQAGVHTRVMTAIEMKNVAEPFIRRRAMLHLEKGLVVIFVAGTGNPYFSTDTTAALRASEVNAEIIFKATKVDGIYDSDPMKNKNAKRYSTLTFSEALRQRLKVMDSTAFSLCMDNNVPILVFDLFKRSNIIDAVMGKKIGTLVTN